MAQNEISKIKKLYCVEYPGNVQNVDRMIETLGGINTISNAFSTSQRKLECKFRPDDKFCKGTVADRSKSRAFLLKVVVKKIKRDYNVNEEKEHIKYSTSVIGKVEHVYKFRNMCDFQYLPMDKDPKGKFVSIYEEIVPNSLINFSWLSEPCTNFLPPTLFSRMDTVQGYLSSAKSKEISSNVIGRTRDRRSNYVRFVSHELKKVPETPNPHTLRYIHLKFVTEEQILKMKELFDERPVWTKLALFSITQFSEVQLKYLLALSAYHFTSGPFRVTWVRFGYDPRKDISARRYQTVDYRLTGSIPLYLHHKLPEKFKVRGRTKFNKNSLNDEEPAENNEESIYIFKPGILPPKKIMMYQLCDIHIPKIQKRLSSLPENVAYDPKNGWLTEEFVEEVRHAIDDCILDFVKNRPVEEHENAGTANDNVNESSDEEDEFGMLEDSYNDYEDDDDGDDDQEDDDE